MALPYFPLYPTDFEADTSHLTLEEDGAFNRLLRLCWLTPGCSLPNDRAWLTRRMRVSDADFDRVVQPVIDEFFRCRKGRIYSQRLSDEWKTVSATRKARVLAGKKGGRPQVSENKPIDQKAGLSKKKGGPKQPDPDPYREEREAKASPKKLAKRLPEDWMLPREWGLWAVQEGWSVDVVRGEADKFRDYWIGVSGQKGTKLDWQATWRNWMRNVAKSGGAQNGRINGHDRHDAARRAAERFERERGVDQRQDRNAVVPLLPARPAARGHGSGDG